MKKRQIFWCGLQYKRAHRYYHLDAKDGGILAWRSQVWKICRGLPGGVDFDCFEDETPIRRITLR